MILYLTNTQHFYFCKTLFSFIYLHNILLLIFYIKVFKWIKSAIASDFILCLSRLTTTRIISSYLLSSKQKINKSVRIFSHCFSTVVKPAHAGHYVFWISNNAADYNNSQPSLVYASLFMKPQGSFSSASWNSETKGKGTDVGRQLVLNLHLQCFTGGCVFENESWKEWVANLELWMSLFNLEFKNI